MLFILFVITPDFVNMFHKLIAKFPITSRTIIY